MLCIHDTKMKNRNLSIEFSSDMCMNIIVQHSIQERCTTIRIVFSDPNTLPNPKHPLPAYPFLALKHEHLKPSPYPPPLPTLDAYKRPPQRSVLHLLPHYQFLTSSIRSQHPPLLSTISAHSRRHTTTTLQLLNQDRILRSPCTRMV